MLRGALAVFVKTIGFSPLKTRLAAGIGKDHANHFYSLACQCLLEQTLPCDPKITSFWAVAEAVDEVRERWQTLPVMEQGQGELGQRLAKVYKTILKQFDFGLLLGADAPQVSTALLLQAAEFLNHFDFVVGPARDGGFYLFAGRQYLDEYFWTSLPYSDVSTCELLLQALDRHGQVKVLEPLTDVDHAGDLFYLANELEKLTALSPAQKQMLHWIRNEISQVQIGKN